MHATCKAHYHVLCYINVYFIYMVQYIYPQGTVLALKNTYTYQFLSLYVAHLPNCEYAVPGQETGNSCVVFISIPKRSGGIPKSIQHWCTSQRMRIPGYSADR
jgi:hypothetical protein